jgi:hypothetical protein
MSQFRKLQKDIENYGEIRWKHAMHLIRLLLVGITALNEGFIPVRVEDHRERLLAIRRGEVAWDEVNQWRLALHKEFDAAFQMTTLPERPDYEAANAYLVRARKYAYYVNLPRKELSELTFNYDQFHAALLTASRDAFEHVRNAHKGETFYAYGLFHEPLWGYIIPVANTEEGLRKRAVLLQSGSLGSFYATWPIEDTMKDIRWTPADWAYFNIEGNHFEQVQGIVATLHEFHFYDEQTHHDRMIFFCRSVLNQLNSEGVFGGWDERMRIVLNIMMGDQDNSWIEHAKALNPSKVYYRWRQEIGDDW